MPSGSHGWLYLRSVSEINSQVAAHNPRRKFRGPRWRHRVSLADVQVLPIGVIVSELEDHPSGNGRVSLG